jgi:hypothetical protein
VFVGWPKEDGAGQVIKCSIAGKDAIDGMHPSDHYAVAAELRY